MANMQISNYKATPDGKLYTKDGKPIKPFKSNKYLQYYLKDDNGKRLVVGAHTVIAYLLRDDYFDGCVVHHIDGNQYNNSVENLICMARSDHTRLHADPQPMIKKIKTNGPANKGKKMSEEFKQHCRNSAHKRPVIAYDDKRICVAGFPSITDAARWICEQNSAVKYSNATRSIQRACKTGSMKSYGYMWEYV